MNDRPWSKRTLEKKNTKSRSKKSSYIEAEKHKREGKEMVEEESTILSQCRLKSHWIFFLVFMVLSWLQIFFFFMWLLNKHKKSISIGSHGFKLDFVSKIWFGRSRKVFLVDEWWILENLAYVQYSRLDSEVFFVIFVLLFELYSIYKSNIFWIGDDLSQEMPRLKKKGAAKGKETERCRITCHPQKNFPSKVHSLQQSD